MSILSSHSGVMLQIQFLVINRMRHLKFSIICIFISFLLGCSSPVGVRSNLDYELVSRLELKNILADSVVAGYNDGVYAPRWFYLGSVDGYHHLFFYNPDSYFNFYSPSYSQIRFLKILKGGLSIPDEVSYDPNLQEAQEVFRRPSSLTLYEQLEILEERGRVPEVSGSEYGIEFFPENPQRLNPKKD
jgi:hypothetical protein